MLAPRICCLDLDTFFVSVERVLDPALRHVPVVVGGARWGSGVVTSASYEARARGVKSGMSIRDASAIATRDTAFVPGHHDAHLDYSRRAREIVERYSPVVVAASIDEQYIDFSGCERLYKRAGDGSDDATIERTVREITAALQRELGLPASAGIATSRAMAKVACGLAKPAGVILVAAGTEEAVLAPLSVRKLPGIGPVAEGKLAARGITTLAQLVKAPDATLRAVFGAYARSVHAAARGAGGDELGRERPAFREHDPRGAIAGSISNERTFIEANADTAASVLSGLCERVCSRARKRGVVAGQVSVRLRYSDFITLTHQRTLTPTADELVVYLHDLYVEARTRELPIRLLGVALAKLRPERVQLGLFDHVAERRSSAVDRVRDKYGYDAVHLASTTLVKKR